MLNIVNKCINMKLPCTEPYKPISSFNCRNINKAVPYLWNTNDNYRVCINDSVIFRDIPDCGIRDVFPNAKLVIFDNCDKNFVYYTFRKDIFPDVEIFILNSHPCDFAVMHRFADKNIYCGYITSTYYKRYLGDWWYPETKHIKEIMFDDYYDKLDSYTEIIPEFI